MTINPEVLHGDQMQQMYVVRLFNIQAAKGETLTLYC